MLSPLVIAQNRKICAIFLADTVLECLLLPASSFVTTREGNFIADLLTGGTFIKEAKNLEHNNFESKMLVRRPNYKILKHVRYAKYTDNERRFNL
jgi:hypothetical protein